MSKPFRYPDREPWGPAFTEWGPVPLSEETLTEMERRVRTFLRGNPSLATYEKRLQAVGAIALKLIEHNACFEEAAP